ncbi:MAG: thioredoxin family protein [Bacteroidetes bacterium]|nr:MAG: thioredoxin family protein [Bacteroidota bacterium]
MFNKLILVFLMIFFSNFIFSQQKYKVYNPKANAKADLQKAIKAAGDNNKNVYVQIGGNWCPWCIRLHKYIKNNTVLDSIQKADYEVIYINYSKENKNLNILKHLGNPQRFGFPVLVILNDKGDVLHIQDSGYLEKEKSYDFDKVKRFLILWNKKNTNIE